MDTVFFAVFLVSGYLIIGTVGMFLIDSMNFFGGRVWQNQVLLVLAIPFVGGAIAFRNLRTSIQSGNPVSSLRVKLSLALICVILPLAWVLLSPFPISSY